MTESGPTPPPPPSPLASSPHSQVELLESTRHCILSLSFQNLHVWFFPKDFSTPHSQIIHKDWEKWGKGCE